MNKRNHFKNDILIFIYDIVIKKINEKICKSIINFFFQLNSP